MTGSSSKTKTKKFAFDVEFKRIQAITESILGEALGATLNQQQFQEALFGLLQPEFDRLARESDLADELGTPQARAELLRSTIDQNTELTRQASELTAQAADAAKNLGTLTDDDRALISGTLQGARDVGNREIDSFISGNFRSAKETAAARGFRPGDSPVGNIRGRIAEEGVRQKGQLESQLASRGSEMALQLPQQRLAALGQLSGQFQGFAQQGNQFQAALQQNATANRLNLASTTGQLGLGLTGLASTGPGALGASRPALGTFTTSSSGGISTKMLKINGQTVDATVILSRLQGLPIEAWQYLWEHGDAGFQVGPYAEDFQEAFGGDSYQISFLHALGVSMVALQELAGRTDRLEARLDELAPVENHGEAV